MFTALILITFGPQPEDASSILALGIRPVRIIGEFNKNPNSARPLGFTACPLNTLSPQLKDTDSSSVLDFLYS